MRFGLRVLGLILAGLLLLPAGAAWGNDQRTPSLPASAPAKKVPPKKWAHSVCTSLSDWQTNLQNLAGSVQSDISAATDLSQAQTVLVTFLGNAVDATDTLLTQLGKAGTPDTKNGDKVAGLLKTGLTDARDIFAKAQSDAKNLDTSDPAQFSAAASNLGTSITQAGQQLSSALNTAGRKYKAANRALNADPACRALSSTSSSTTTTAATSPTSG